MSAYLDLLRFFAAVIVLLHHASPILFPGVPLPFPGHHAVILFFVISGFVIAHVAARPTLNFRNYASDRLSRLLSVTAPALLLGLVITLSIGSQLNSIPAAKHLGDVAMSLDQALLRAGINLMFCGQLWGLNSMAPLNGVFWSLNYEFWYYLIFAAWHFSRPPLRAILVTATLLAAGPKILLLLPCWLAGVWLYRGLDRWELPQNCARFLFTLSVVAYLVVFWFDVPVLIRNRMDQLWPNWMASLGGSRSFVGDYLLTALFLLNCVAFASMNNAFTQAVSRAETAAKLLGSYTFSVYAFHTPLLALSVLALSHLPAWRGAGITALVAVTLGAVALAGVTEHKRQLLRSLMRSKPGSSTPPA